MKTLKYIGFSLLSLSIIFVIFGYFQNREVFVSRSVVVNAPVEIVFDQFNDLNKRMVWSPWEKQDSTMVNTMGDITKGLGANYSWESPANGDGKLSYTQVIPNQLIESALQFGPPEEDPAQGLMIFKEVQDGVKVTWEVHMDLGNNPVMRVMGRYINDMVGKTFENGLAHMKEIAEKEEPQPAITLVALDAVPYISIFDSCSTKDLAQRVGTNYSILYSYLGGNQLATAGYPRTSYSTWNPPTLVSFQQMVLINVHHNSAKDGIISGMTYAGKALKITHKGSYETSANSWETIYAYAAQNSLEINGTPWEEYENSPVTESNPENLITHIYLPIK